MSKTIYSLPLLLSLFYTSFGARHMKIERSMMETIIWSLKRAASVFSFLQHHKLVRHMITLLTVMSI